MTERGRERGKERQERQRGKEKEREGERGGRKRESMPRVLIEFLCRRVASEPKPNDLDRRTGDFWCGCSSVYGPQLRKDTTCRTACSRSFRQLMTYENGTVNLSQG